GAGRAGGGLPHADRRPQMRPSHQLQRRPAAARGVQGAVDRVDRAFPDLALSVANGQSGHGSGASFTLGNPQACAGAAFQAAGHDPAPMIPPSTSARYDASLRLSVAPMMDWIYVL